MAGASQARYSAGAIIFHWIIAILVIVNWRIAEGAEHLEGAAKAIAIAPHKAIGITILVLSILRLAWRLTHRPPAPPASVAGWERKLAKAVHITFYVLLIGLPIGGWLATSFAGAPINYFGLFTIPIFPVEQNFDTAGAIIAQHKNGGTLVLALVVLHVLGALKHSFIDKIPGVSRMWFGKNV